MNEERKELFKKALEPLIGPADVVLVLCRDDSRTVMYGRDYTEAYKGGMFTAEHTCPSVILGYKLLGELLAGHMEVCLPQSGKNLDQVQAGEAEARKFQQALASGTLMPADTFPVLAQSYRDMGVVLEGHMASCMPEHFRKMAEAIKQKPTKVLYGADGKPLTGQGREPS